MTAQTYTGHALLRMAQRGISPGLIDLVQTIGVEVDGGFVVTRKESQRILEEFRRISDQLRRVEGKRVVVAGDRVVTAYHATPKKMRRLLREAEERDLES